MKQPVPHGNPNPRRGLFARRRAPQAQTDERSYVLQTHECPSCSRKLEPEALEEHLFTCDNCGHHLRISSSERLRLTLDAGTYEERHARYKPANPLEFPDYPEKLARAQQKSGLDEAVQTGYGQINGRAISIAAMSFSFLGGSMGSVVGERIARAMLDAANERIPCVVFTASGGARMQEGIFSLMQMAKTSHAAALMRKASAPLFIVLTDPTTGGTSASFSMLGDVILAEPEALIGFAGPRVIEGTIRQKLPEGFQRAEFQQEKGFVDMVVPRRDMRRVLTYLIDTHMQELRG